MLDHQDKNMMKAQVHVSKSFAISDVQPLPQRKHFCQIYQMIKHMFRGRLLASFQDREHEGGDTRSQGSIKDNDIKIKIQYHSMQMISQKIPKNKDPSFKKDLFSLEMVKVEYLEKKGKQHKASYKAKLVNSISKPLHMLHMDLFGLTNVKSLMKKSYCLVIIDDFSRFSWIFFLATKDENSGILKIFITRIENQLDWIKMEFSVGMTPQQNGVAKRKNRTLVKAARTMLVDFKLPTTFWAEAVNTACYVLNKALVIKPHNKTPYELIHGRPPLIEFMKPFGCPITILNTKDYLGKFDEKVDVGFFVKYYVVSKAMRVFNKRTRIVEETLNIRFLENSPNVKGNGPDSLFDIDSLTIFMNYVPVVAGFQTNGIIGIKDNIVAVDAEKKATKVDESQVLDNGGQDDQVTRSEREGLLQQETQTKHINNTNSFNTVSSPVNTAGPSFVNAASPSPNNAAGTPANTNAFEEHSFERFSSFKNAFSLPHVPIVTPINDTGIFGNAYDDEVMEEEVDMNNVVSSYTIPDAPLTKFLKDHHKDQGHTQEEGIDYDEVFALVARIEAIRLFLAYASFKDFVVYQMDVKSDFLYEKIKEEVYVCKPPSFEDPDFLDKVYKTASTQMEPNKALVKDANAEDVDVHLYRSMIRSIMYLPASRPDITFAVCARFQVTPKTSHLYAMKRIFRYLKGQPKLGLWYHRDLPFDLEAYSDSDYIGASLDRKSTTGGCQFLGKRLILWQCKKQTIVANSTTEAEYVAATSCYEQMLWIQN
nr:hypothetical protein [Tanacetum cinerariifolium]